MKRNLFIGSSKEGADIATMLKVKLENELQDWIDVTIWNDGTIFNLNSSALDSLVKVSRKYDYGILIATNDDVALVRDKMEVVPRDNVLFELGMFVGSLGLSRAFMLIENGNKLMSDYNGITLPYFKRDDEVSLNRAFGQVIKAIKSTQQSFNIRPIPSSSLAMGYFENLIQKLAKKWVDLEKEFTLEVLIPKKINDIDISISQFKKNNNSVEESVYEKNTRPSIYKYEDKSDIYWDIPTTLKTLHKLMGYFIPNQEIGLNPEKEEWIECELRNFIGTLRVLIDECPACKDNVVVKFID
jgi:hypothetical protein